MITLVLGGVRSGKSEVAECLAGPGPGTYLATGRVDPGDPDFAARVARHRARRPAAWVTVEEPAAVPEALAALLGTVLIDALGAWIANGLGGADGGGPGRVGSPTDVAALIAALVGRDGDTVVVSEEVGLGVHPVSEVGRLFADRLGEANRRVAEVADRCFLVVAGRTIELPTGRPGPAPDPPAAGPTNPPARGGAGGGLRPAVAFLTPLGGAAAPGPAAFTWFPPVGAALGGVLGAVWWATEWRLGPLAAAAVVVAADLALTGALHFDGLLDSADGLLPHLDRRRRLAVMAEPDVGAFAIAVGGAVLLLRTAVLAGFGAARPLLLAGLWCLSRTAMVVTASACPYARQGGLASSFLAGPAGPGGRRRWAGAAAVGIVLSVGLAAADDPRSVVACAAGAGAAAGVAVLARRRLGGFTGDTLGAAGVIAETTGLLTALAVLRP